MKLMKESRFWLSAAAGVCLFALTFPFYHDMYIPQLFTALCILLNAASAALAAAFICCCRTARTDSDTKAIFLWFAVLLGIGQGIFAMMNWGAWLFLLLFAGMVCWLVWPRRQ